MNSRLSGIAVVVLLVSVATFLAYMNSFESPFIFDDLRNIAENHQIRISDLSLAELWRAAQGNPTPRPIAYLSFALNYYFGGLNVWGYHLVNILIHLVNGLLVYCLAKVLLQIDPKGNEGEQNRETYFIALATALIFVLHPVQTQSVSFLVQRMTSLCAMFYFMALLAWWYGRFAEIQSRRIIGYSVAFVLWVFALGTKQFAVTLPAAILMIEWLFIQKGNWNIRYVYGGIGTAVAVAVACYAFKGEDFFQLFTRGYTQREFTLNERLMTEGRVIARYVSLLIWPAPERLTLVYDFPLSKSLIQPISTLVCWCGIGLGIGVASWTAKTQPVFSFAVFWFFLHLVVESTIIPLEIIYEHRLYLPSFGFFFLVSAGLFRFLNNRNLTLVMIALLCVGLGYWTHVRNRDWQTGMNLWADNVRKAPAAARPLLGLAMENAKIGEYQTAMELLERAIDAEPNFQILYVRRGQIYKTLNRNDMALKDFDYAISIPHEIRRGQAYNEAFTARGNLHRIAGRFDLAAEDLDAALKFSQHNSRTFLARGDLNSVRNRPAEAISDYKTAIELRPDSINAKKNLAWLLATIDDVSLADAQAAIAFASNSCELTDWKDHSAISTLAAAYARAGEFTKAVETQQKAIQVAPASMIAPLQARVALFGQQKAIVITRNGNSN